MQAAQWRRHRHWSELQARRCYATRLTSHSATAQVSLSGLPNDPCTPQLPPQDIRLAALQLTPWLLDMRHRCCCLKRMHVRIAFAGKASYVLTQPDSLSKPA